MAWSRSTQSPEITTARTSAWFSMYASRSPRRPVLSGTSTMPALARPIQVNMNSGQLGSITATLSPFPMPRPRKALASRFAMRSSSP